MGTTYEIDLIARDARGCICDTRTVEVREYADDDSASRALYVVAQRSLSDYWTSVRLQVVDEPGSWTTIEEVRS